jgi:hypothetical protein
MAITISGDSPNLTSASLTTPTLTSPTFAGTPSGSIITRMTAQASTSGTSIDFTSIPSWVKRITIMFDSVSTNGTAQPLFQLGAGSVTTSGYVTTSSRLQDSVSTAVASSTAGFILNGGSASNAISGAIQISNITGNIWVAQGVFAATVVATLSFTSSGISTLSGTLDRVRITTTNGTDTFDAGTINILYE